MAVLMAREPQRLQRAGFVDLGLHLRAVLA
jgi:hypothetical protein